MLSDTDYDEITGERFAGFTGPYIIPNGNAFDVKVRLTPVTGGEYPVMVKDFTGNTLSRNERLILNVWVAELQQDSDIIISITAETAPITDVAEGEAGIWD